MVCVGGIPSTAAHRTVSVDSSTLCSAGLDLGEQQIKTLNTHNHTHRAYANTSELAGTRLCAFRRLRAIVCDCVIFD